MNPDDPRRAIVMDTLLAVGMLALSIASVVVWHDDAQPGRELDGWGYVLMAGQTLPLILRRRFPVPVLVVIVTAFMLDRGINYPGSWAFFGIAFAMYTIGTQLPPRRSLLVGGVTLDIVLLWTTVGIFLYDVDPFSLVGEIAVLGFPLLVGRETYHRQQRMVDLERRAVEAGHDRERREEEAVAQERIRIARELHDVVAHEITVMTIQSAGARRVLDEDPARAREAMESAEAAGHRALTEVRRLLGMLRTADPKTTKDPQPGLESLDRLVAQMNQAGLETKLSITGEPRPLPLGVDLNAYRIIQESLTNTLKHGGPDVQSKILVAYHETSLSIEVTDDGRGAAAWSDPDTPGQGHVGMHERATLLDGVVHAGPRPGGGYRVFAEIPIPSA